MTCDEIDSLLPEYILGELTPDQTDEIDQHLANGCEICQYNLRDFNAAAVAVFDDVRPIRPPDDVLAKVYERLKIAMDRDGANRDGANRDGANRDGACHEAAYPRSTSDFRFGSDGATLAHTQSAKQMRTNFIRTAIAVVACFLGFVIVPMAQRLLPTERSALSIENSSSFADVRQIQQGSLH